MDMVSMLAERRSVQRRTALRALGLGVTAVAASSVTTEAKKKKGGQKVKDRCPGQVSSCEAAFTGFCIDPMFQDECLEAARECCAPLATCDTSAAMERFIFRFLTA